MTMVLFLVLAVAAWLQLRRPRPALRRIFGPVSAPGGPARRFRDIRSALVARRPPAARPVSMVVLVQQLASLLRGGRGPSQLWEELWQVHHSARRVDNHGQVARSLRPAAISEEALRVLGAARAASAVGSSTADAIRRTVATAYAPRGNVERRIWVELAACLDVAEISGCPLADLLTRFAAQLEAEEDAEAARQTALAGPKATVRLLSWLPVFGLVLGMALGVDPLGILLGNIVGMGTLAAGLLLTVAGRVWSSRLVASAAGGP
ncbi:type II secretion system F family protein [Paenarthrobacter sp. NPDC089714]|uniref:type II secretion system F family protein n=1 Tax=unclassified Paenarthrobacter TaxID=2634190 RepID=UPI0037FC2738